MNDAAAFQLLYKPKFATSAPYLWIGLQIGISLTQNGFQINYRDGNVMGKMSTFFGIGTKSFRSHTREKALKSDGVIMMMT